ncbi:MAG: valine--tRNA ligase [Phycisphaerae bacterium]|nr:valine--tRNA ligase [Phycisphaerae bacterium]
MAKGGGTYDPGAIETEIYAFWERGDGHRSYFAARPDSGRVPFTIVIPPPNVTGALHLGHALNNTLQDILIRRKRMQGFDACWLPGTDHAGIATQAVVEKRLLETEKKTRNEIGREALVERIWKWKDEYEARILGQLRKMGCSCDWERTRFTLDETCARAVYETFFRLFKDGLIYRGTRLVNWDAALQTAVADDELYHESVKGHLWHIRYPVADSNGATEQRSDGGAAPSHLHPSTPFLTIATTRPETMLGDTALAVHPDDPRYQHLIGKHVTLPLVHRRIPVIADPILVDPKFGTGVVKVTPAHDPNDYECGLRNNLPQLNILTKDGRIRDDDEGKRLFGPYAGMERYAARKQIVKDLEAASLLEKAEPHEHEVGHSDRSKTPIEPMLSEQWFVKMAPLAEPALEAVRDGRVNFFPPRYAKTYLDWLGEKRDWCVSRQLWWGHRIPVWSYYGLAHQFASPAAAIAHGEVREKLRLRLQTLVASGAVAICYEDEPIANAARLDDREAFATKKHRICIADPGNSELVKQLADAGYEQDPDVLDTWFSSALWPFSTFGWPEKNSEQAEPPPASNPEFAIRYSQFAIHRYYPTSVLSTARDIISLWVARMVIMGLYNTGDKPAGPGRVPFSHVCIHPVIQDGNGRRMSKSTGNGVDPLDLIELYGTDAMRFTLASMAGETQDLRIPVSYHCPHCDALTQHSSVVPHNKFPRDIPKVKCKGCGKEFATVWADQPLKDQLGVGLDTSERFELGRNFCNKLWQAATGFVLANLTEESNGPRTLSRQQLALEDRWILSRLQACIAEVDRRIEAYQFSDAAGAIYAFFWGEFCDWYVELVKPRLAKKGDAAPDQRSDESRLVARQVLAFVLDQTLRLLHPIAPFVTEALWHRLNAVAAWRGIDELQEGGPALIVAEWPRVQSQWIDADAELRMSRLQDVVRALRDVKTRVNGIRAAARETVIRNLPQAVLRADARLTAEFEASRAALLTLGNCDAIDIGERLAKPPEAASKIFAGYELYVSLSGLANLDLERQRLGKEIDETRGHIERIGSKLGNESYVRGAPPAVVERDRAKLEELRSKLTSLEENLAGISN